MSRKIVIGVFVLLFLLSLLGAYLQKSSLVKTVTVPSVVKYETLPHVDLVSRLSRYFPASQLNIDIPEKDITELPGYLPLSAKKSHDGQSIVTSYITDCSQDLWDLIEDHVELPPGITKVDHCSWNVRSFLSDRNGNREVTFQCNENMPQWHFIPQARAGSWNANPLILGWSPNDKKIVAQILPIGCLDREASSFAAYDIGNRTWTFAPTGNLSDDLSSILVTTKSPNNIPSCDEGATIGQYLTPNMVAIWDIERGNGKSLHEKDKSLYQIVNIDWANRSAQIKRFKMDGFIVADSSNGTINKQCINGQNDYMMSRGGASKVPFEIVTIRW